MTNTLVTRISKSPSKYERPRVLTIDECCNNRHIVALSENILKHKYVDACFPIWDQARVIEDGSVIQVQGGYKGGAPPDFDWGKPKKNYSFPDSSIALLVEANVKNSDVFFLSENTKMNEGGIRKLLREKTDREPNTHLVAIYKKGNTRYSDYRIEVEEKIKKWEFSEAFEEILV